jgi:hypothetical protein
MWAEAAGGSVEILAAVQNAALNTVQFGGENVKGTSDI